MPAYIIHKDGVYNLYSTIADGCWFEHGLTIDQLREYVRFEHGQQGLDELSSRLERAHKTGCSGNGWSLDSCIRCNRAGPNEAHMTREDFTEKYLTLLDNKGHRP